MQTSTPVPSGNNPSHSSPCCSALWTPLAQDTRPGTPPAQLPTPLTKARWNAQTTGLTISSQPQHPSPTQKATRGSPLLSRQLGCTDASSPTQLTAELSGEQGERPFPQGHGSNPLSQPLALLMLAHCTATGEEPAGSGGSATATQAGWSTQGASYLCSHHPLCSG